MDEPSKKNSPDPDAPWTREEVDRLRRFRNAPPSVIIRKFKNHSLASIEANYQRIMAETPKPNQSGSHWWLRDEDALIKKHFEKSGLAFLTRIMKGRTEAQIADRAAVLNVAVEPESTSDHQFLIQEHAKNGRWKDVMVVTRVDLNRHARQTRSKAQPLTTLEVRAWFYKEIELRNRKPLEHRVRLIRREQESSLSTVDTVIAPHEEKAAPSPRVAPG